MAHILPSGGGKALMNVDDAVLLLLDHQSGLFQTVKDITVAELRANVSARQDWHSAEAAGDHDGITS
jgi:hypothetical protein